MFGGGNLGRNEYREYSGTPHTEHTNVLELSNGPSRARYLIQMIEEQRHGPSVRKREDSFILQTWGHS
jgi:hypothetical protein